MIGQEPAYRQNRQNFPVLDIGSSDFLRYKSSRRLSVLLCKKLPQFTFPCTFLASEPVSLHQDVFYYETLITSLHDRSQTLVGFSARQPSNAQNIAPPKALGFDPVSYGLRADGHLFANGAKLTQQQTSRLRLRTGIFEGYKEGDIVGCGILLRSKVIFFTLNGAHLGVAFRDIELGINDQAAGGQASELIAAIQGEESRPERYVHSKFISACRDSCNLYPAICLQVQGDAIKCNFGAKPFVFDIDSHFERLAAEEWLSRVRTRPVQLRSMYALVKDYLVKSAYTETLAAIENEYLGKEDFIETTQDQDETKEKNLSLQRKMTLDLGGEAAARPKNVAVESPSVNETPKETESDGSRSMLTTETEVMVPLAAVECLPNARSTKQSSVTGGPDANSIEGEKTYVSDYVEELLATCQTASLYETNLQLNLEIQEDTSPQKTAKRQTVQAFAALQAAGDDGQALQRRLLVLSRSKSTSVSKHLRDGLMPGRDEEDDLRLRNASLLERRGQLRALLADNQFEQASKLLHSLFKQNSSRSDAAALRARVCITTLIFVDRVCQKDFASAVQLLKDQVFQVAGASVPVWDAEQVKAVERPISALAGLLCYSDPLTQSKGTQVAQFLSTESRRCIEQALITATDVGKQEGESVKLELLLRQLQATDHVLKEARQN